MQRLTRLFIVGNLTVQFTDISKATPGSIKQWFWDFGDGTPASFISNPMHSYHVVSSFAVNLSVSSSLCPTLTNSKTRIINIVEPRAGRAYPPKVTSYGIPTLLELRAGLCESVSLKLFT